MTREEATIQYIMGYIEAIDALEETIKALQQEPNTGHWIANNAKNYPGWIHCSECGEDWTHDGRPLYCPACGARMEESR